MRKSLIIALVALVASIVVPAAHADPSAIERIIAQETAKHLDPKSPYNPQGYVPGGATQRVAQAIVEKATPKPYNPQGYVRGERR